jgi:hypothetical protein
MVPVAHSHGQLIGATASSPSNGAILTPIPLCSLAGISLALVPALQHGVPLVLHHPFDDAVFDAQQREHRCGTVILPGSIAAALREAGTLTHEHAPRTVVALWRSPEKWHAASPWFDAPRMLDRLALGETAITQAARESDGKPRPIDVSALPGVAVRRIVAGTPSAHGWIVPDAA